MGVANPSAASTSSPIPIHGTLSNGNNQWNISAGVPVGTEWHAKDVNFTTTALLPTESKLTEVTVSCPAYKVTTGALETRANVFIGVNIQCAGQLYTKTLYGGQEQQSSGSVSVTDNAPNFFWVDSNGYINIYIIFTNQDSVYATSHYCGTPTLTLTYDDGQVKNLFFGSDF